MTKSKTIKKSKNYSAGGKKSLGLVLILNLLVFPSLFGIDRFYTGKIDAGLAMAIGTMSVIGLFVTTAVNFLSTLFLTFSILSNRDDVFLYGGVVFNKPNLFDKLVAIFAIILFIFYFSLSITLSR